MGHDITATKSRNGQQIAYLRIGGLKRRTTGIYRALKIQSYNALDSGTGDSAGFTIDQVIAARDSPHVNAEEKKFLQKCITESGGGGITMKFE